MFRRIFRKPPPPPVVVETPPPRRDLTIEIETAAVDAAQALGVSGQIHPADYIFWSIHDAQAEDKADRAAKEYMQSGRIVAEAIRDTLPPAFVARDIRLLDFAGGYARVARHLNAVLPRAEVTLCDIHEEAVAFARSIGLEAVQSTWAPRTFAPGDAYA